MAVVWFSVLQAQLKFVKSQCENVFDCFEKAEERITPPSRRCDPE